MISHKYKCIFPRIGKNASTTIISYFKKIDSDIIDEGHLMVSIGIKEYLKSKNIDHYFKFAFVRNPYDRLYSAWNEFKKPNRFIELKNTLKNLTVLDYFDKFIEFSFSIDHIHWKPQYDILYSNDELLVDYIGKVENIRQDIIQITKTISAPFIDNIPTENQSNKSLKEYWYTDKIKDIVYTKYRNDFIYFNYDR